MTRIINANTGETVGYTEEPRYIRRKDTGVLVQCREEAAGGVAFRSTPYNLRDTSGVDAAVTVYLAEVDAETAWRETEEMYQNALHKLGVET